MEVLGESFSQGVSPFFPFHFLFFEQKENVTKVIGFILALVIFYPSSSLCHLVYWCFFFFLIVYSGCLQFVQDLLGGVSEQGLSSSTPDCQRKKQPKCALEERTVRCVSCKVVVSSLLCVCGTFALAISFLTLIYY